MIAKIYNFKTIDDFFRMVNICRKIKEKDPTFKFDFKLGNQTILIHADNKDTLHKRCTWLITKGSESQKEVYQIVKK